MGISIKATKNIHWQSHRYLYNPNRKYNKQLLTCSIKGVLDCRNCEALVCLIPLKSYFFSLVVINIFLLKQYKMTQALGLRINITITSHFQQFFLLFYQIIFLKFSSFHLYYLHGVNVSNKEASLLKTQPIQRSPAYCPSARHLFTGTHHLPQCQAPFFYL